MTRRTQVLLNTIAVIKAQTPPAPEGADIGEEESIIEMEIRRR